MENKNNKKVVLGQYFTKERTWLQPQVVEFIKKSKCFIAYDPFAGEGDLLREMMALGFEKVKGLDKDRSLNWTYNDSLINIPSSGENAIIITNPPYLTNYSASRKKIFKKVKKYFINSCYDDLYLIALDKMLEAQKFVVAIIPETFINSAYKQKNKLKSITILENSPFQDTETPIIVVCFDGKEKDFSDIKVYKNDRYINTLSYFENMRISADKNFEVKFNDLEFGWLAVRCVDTTDPNKKIAFGFKKDFDYDWQKGIKASSRLLTLVNVKVPIKKRSQLIKECNRILCELREKTSDVILSPFKCNMKNGVRRRRLDFKTCKAIIQQAYNNVVKK